jgi:cytochrome oxidase Cu insertion factor (SCO1/SenC/PrrC family)
MSERGKILAIYSAVALVAAGIVGMSWWINRSIQEAKFRQQGLVIDSGAESPESWFPIKGDLAAINQDGTPVQISELRGKVWVVAEFFAVCPLCARRNAADLKTLYERYGDNPDFHIVCVSVDPEQDKVEKLKEYAEAFGAKSSNWWFLTGEREVIHRYLTDELKFLAVQERSDPDEIAAEGRYRHDMGLIVVNRDMQVVVKRDLAWAGQQSESLREDWEKGLRKIIQRELDRPASKP